MSETTYLYWIHLKKHTDIFSEGYVGVSNNPTRRFSEHKKSNYNHILEAAIKQYDDLCYSVMFEGSEEECYLLENKYRPSEYIGWNMAIGGRKPPISKPGWNHTDDAKKKIADKKIGSLNPNFGKKTSDITKQKISDAKSGIPKTDDHKRKMSEAVSGTKNPNFGKKTSEETKRKISESLKNRLKFQCV